MAASKYAGTKKIKGLVARVTKPFFMYEQNKVVTD
jgi:hypothetical protein